MFLLVASILALGLGPGLVALGRRAPRVLALIELGVPLILVGFVVLEVLPHALHEAGAWALLALGAGVVIPSLLEHAVGEHDHGEHPSPSRSTRLAVLVALAGLALHAAVDGVAIAADVSNDAVSTLGLGVVLHRVTDGASVVWLGQGRLSRNEVWGGLLVIALATVVGYAAAMNLLQSVGEVAMGWLLSLLAGVLLHVTVAHAAVFKQALTVAQHAFARLRPAPPK